jgi:hypothetical protein
MFSSISDGVSAISDGMVRALINIKFHKQLSHFK